jgi:hypothetical protein
MGAAIQDPSSFASHYFLALKYTNRCSTAADLVALSVVMASHEHSPCLIMQSLIVAECW